MVKFVVMMILSIVITQIFHILFGEENSGIEKKQEKIFKVILAQGVIGCTSQEKFDNLKKSYSLNDQEQIKKMLSEKKCFVFDKGEEFVGLDNYCNDYSKMMDNHIFSSKKFLLTKIILPCFAFIEVKKTTK